MGELLRREGEGVAGEPEGLRPCDPMDYPPPRVLDDLRRHLARELRDEEHRLPELPELGYHPFAHARRVLVPPDRSDVASLLELHEHVREDAPGERLPDMPELDADDLVEQLVHRVARGRVEGAPHVSLRER